MSNDGQAQPDDKNMQAQQDGRNQRRRDGKNAAPDAMSAARQRDERSREEPAGRDVTTNAMSARAKSPPAATRPERSEVRVEGSARAKRAVETSTRVRRI